MATGLELPRHSGSPITLRQLECSGAGFYELAERFSSRPGFVLLDSRSNESGLGEFSILSFAPFAKAVSKGGRTSVTEDRRTRASHSDPFETLNILLDRYRTLPGCPELPFLGGAMGYFGFELGRQIEVLPGTVRDELGLPDYFLGFYNFAVTLRHCDGNVFLSHFSPDGCSSAWSLEQVEAELVETQPPGETQFLYSRRPAEIQRDFTQREYENAVARVKDYIRAGDVYQVNVTQRFRACLGDVTPWQLYQRLMEVNPAPFAAYLNCGNHSVLCSSPERFLLIKDRYCETRPVKGTVRRGSTAEEDVANREWLLNSAKNRAELAMVVDLLRNDLGRVCKPGTIHVRAFPEIESYASVHHLVATITGELSKGTRMGDLIRATFPGGSITGAPKIRAMEIIDELEPVARTVYTGSIGYLGFNGAADLNIAIRTLIVKDGIAYIHAGGGVVADSDEREEYEESLLKASRLFRAIETV